MDNKNLKEALSHIFKEFEFHNILISVHGSDFEKLRKAHDAVHEFMFLPTHLINSDEEFHAKSAFLFYQNEAFDRAHTSLLNALTGHYNAAYTLLRDTLELVVKGAFWECLAHKKYREKAEIVKKKSGKKIKKSKITLVDALNEAIDEDPSIETELEEYSVSILDAISPFFEGEDDKTLKKNIIPNLKVITEQLAAWDIFDPIQETIDPVVEYVYDFYSELSKDVHVDPDKMDIGRRLLSKKELFETEIIIAELNKYCENLHRIMDIGIVVELSILEDYIIQNDTAKSWLKERLVDIAMLDLNYSSTKIAEILG